MPAETTQFAGVMRELGIQQIFALSPQAKGRVERMLETFQDRLVTELRLAGASNIGEANKVLQEYLPRFNARFSVAADQPETAYRPVPAGLSLTETICMKDTRKVARDNTVKYHWRALQLLPGQQRRSYAGAAVVVLEGLDGRLSVQHEGRIIAAQEAPPSPGALRNGKGSAASAAVPSPVPEPLGEPQAGLLEQLIPKIDGREDYGAAGDREEMVGMTVSATPRKPTFLQRERWKAVQQAKLRGLSIRRMAKELGIHRETVRRYIDSESPPARRSPAAPPAPASDTISD